MESQQERTLKVLVVGYESFTLPFVGFGFDSYSPEESSPEDLIKTLKQKEKNYDLILIAESIAVRIFDYIKSREYDPNITYLIVPDGSETNIAEDLMTERIIKALGAKI